MSHQSVIVYQKPAGLLLQANALSAKGLMVVDLETPVRQLPPSVEAAELGNALQQLVLQVRTGVAHPSDWKWWNQQWLIHLGARSARAFFKDCKVCAVSHFNGQFEIWATSTNGVGSSLNTGKPLVVSGDDANATGQGFLQMLEQSQ
jgi:hypothetical protein